MLPMRDGLPSLILLSGLILSPMLQADEWTRFRGPNGNAQSDSTQTPVKWSDTEKVVWKTPLPGPGTSLPIVTGGKIFLTSYTGFGVSAENPGDPAKLERVLVCLDEGSGKILWQKGIRGVANEDRYQGFLATHGYASSTPVTDGERVYVLFGKAGVVAFDLEGRQLWHKSVGTGSARMGWGSACSPIIYKNLVIVNAAAESNALYAFDGVTGQEVWKKPADSLDGCWGTPIIVERAGAPAELVLAVGGEIWGFNPETGKFLWYCETPGGDAICSSLVSRDEIVFMVTGGPGGGGAAAVRVGGTDNVTKTHRLWTTQRVTSYITSPVLVGDHLYGVNDNGLAYCLNSKTGETVYQQRLPERGQLYASLTAAGDKLYAVTRDQGTFVLAAKPEFAVLAHNKLSDAGICNGSPTVSKNRLLLRTDKFLYSLGDK
ncbi:MAG: PQQ-binding-like beta-propeller repeat protein [Planctomycetes bacterium]|nr:PQQ-binding-like beta-propeller repeat protein [Planctomycetota bacterium]